MTAPSGGLRRRILGWADDEFVLGHQLGEMVGAYFDLEEAVALGSLAQDHLVHARELYGLLGIEELELDRFVFERDPAAFLNSRLVEERVDDDFAAVVVKMALYSVAEDLRVASAAGDDALADVAGRIGAEEAYHREHWWDWMGILARSAEGRPRAEAALAALVPLTVDFFDLDSGAPDGAAEFGSFRTALGERLSAVGLRVAEFPDPGLFTRRGTHGPGLASSLESLRMIRQPGAHQVVWG